MVKVALQEQAQVADARVIDHHVGGAEALSHRLGEGLHRRLVGDIHGVGHAGHPQRLDLFADGLQCTLVQIRRHDSGALAGEGQRRGPADTRGRASYHDNLIP